MSAESVAFIPKKQFRHNGNTNAQSVSYAQIISSEKAKEKNSGAEIVYKETTELQEVFDLVKEIEKS